MPPYFPLRSYWRASSATDAADEDAAQHEPGRESVDGATHGHGYSEASAVDSSSPAVARGKPTTGTDAQGAGLAAGDAALSTFIVSAEPVLSAAREKHPGDAMLGLAAASPAQRDGILARYLACCSMDTSKALQKLTRTLQWRAEHRLETVPYSIMGGPGVRLPVLIPRLGLGHKGEMLMFSAPRHTVKPIDYPSLEKAIGVFFDTVLYTPPPQGFHSSGMFAVIDLYGLSISQFDLQSFRIGVPLYLNHYSGAIKRICVLNYTTAMYTLWRVISPLLDHETRSRIVFVTAAELNEELGKAFPSAAVPIWLGGTGGPPLSSAPVCMENGAVFDAEGLLKRVRDAS